MSKAVKDTQSKVERYYYELRKGLFDFDEVLAAQREATYARRDAVLRAPPEAALATLSEFAALVTSDIFNANWPSEATTLDGAAAEKLASKLGQFFGPGYGVNAAQLSGAASRSEAHEAASQAAVAAVKAKAAELDGVRAGLAHEASRYLTLLQMDNLWTGHMKAMGFVKDFAGLKVSAHPPRSWDGAHAYASPVASVSRGFGRAPDDACPSVPSLARASLPRVDRSTTMRTRWTCTAQKGSRCSIRCKQLCDKTPCTHSSCTNPRSSELARGASQQSREARGAPWRSWPAHSSSEQPGRCCAFREPDEEVCIGVCAFYAALLCRGHGLDTVMPYASPRGCEVGVHDDDGAYACAFCGRRE